jgi:hypothetical protein
MSWMVTVMQKAQSQQGSYSQ